MAHVLEQRRSCPREALIQVHEKLSYMFMKSHHTSMWTASNIITVGPWEAFTKIMYTRRLLAMQDIIVYRYGTGTANVHEKLLYKSTCPWEVAFTQFSKTMSTRSYCTGLVHVHEKRSRRPCPREAQLTVFTRKKRSRRPCPWEGSHAKLLVYERLSYICVKRDWTRRTREAIVQDRPDTGPAHEQRRKERLKAIVRDFISTRTIIVDWYIWWHVYTSNADHSTVGTREEFKKTTSMRSFRTSVQNKNIHEKTSLWERTVKLCIATILLQVHKSPTPFWYAAAPCTREKTCSRSSCPREAPIHVH